MMIMGLILLCAQICSVLPSYAESQLSIEKSKIATTKKIQKISPRQFQQALLKSLKDQFKNPNVGFSVQLLSPKTPIEVPKGHIQIQVPPDRMNGRMGRRAYRMGLSVNHEFQRMVNVVADIEARMPLVVPVRFIKLHETINAKDVKVTDFSIPTMTQDYVKGLEGVIGKKAARLLPPNLPIQQQYIAEPPVVHKGDRVIIEARHGGLLVQTVGIAKDTGEPGKIIAVENQHSKREVLGRVLQAGLVEVTF